jgi:hypothetical protein
MDTELFSLFEKFCLHRDATLIAEKLGMSSVDDFAYVEIRHIEGLGLKPVPESKLLRLRAFVLADNKTTSRQDFDSESG